MTPIRLPAALLKRASVSLSSIRPTTPNIFPTIGSMDVASAMRFSGQVLVHPGLSSFVDVAAMIDHAEAVTR